jgi:hypothetical protein
MLLAGYRKLEITRRANFSCSSPAGSWSADSRASSVRFACISSIHNGAARWHPPARLGTCRTVS